MHLDNVSCETRERLDKFVASLLKWNKIHNLIAEGTEPDVIQRHIIDSYQLINLLPHEPTTILDFGTGAGFPGFVIACDGLHHMVLCEKSAKRTAFLRYVSRETGVACEVFDKKLEEDTRTYDVIVSRAVSSLTRLWELCETRLNPGGYALFMKGKSYRDELQKFNSNGVVTFELIPSITDKESVIIKLIKR